MTLSRTYLGWKQIQQTGAGATAPLALTPSIVPFQVTLKTTVSGTVDYDIQYTTDDIYATGYDPDTGDWSTLSAMDGLTAASEDSLISPVTAVRILQNSGDGTTTLKMIQAGIK